MSQQRNTDLAKIHIARQQLGMNDDDYRAMLLTIGRVKSSAQLDVYGRSRVLAHLASLGWKPSPRGKPRRAVSAQPQDKKIRALWLELAVKGAVRDRSEDALLSYVRRLTGCDRLEWITSKQASIVIESLKSWLSRATS